MGNLNIQPDTLANLTQNYSPEVLGDAVQYVQERLAGQNYRLIIMGGALVTLMARNDVTALEGATCEVYRSDMDDPQDTKQREAVILSELVNRDNIAGLFTALSARVNDGTHIVFAYPKYPQEVISDDGSRRIMQPLSYAEVDSLGRRAGLVVHKWFGLLTGTQKALMLQEQNPDMSNLEAFSLALQMPDLPDSIVRMVLTKGIDMSDFPEPNT